MGWDVVDSGFKVVLSPEVPQLVREQLRGDVDALPRRRTACRAPTSRTGSATPAAPRCSRRSRRRWSCRAQALAAHAGTRCSRSGNLSSASVLFVLADLLDAGEARPGDLGLLLAMGPGFCSELVLLEW